MWGIVEKIIDDKVYVIFSNRSTGVYKNNLGVKISENNEVEIIDDEIIMKIYIKK